MRDIRFRGKRIDNGEWVYGYFTKCPLIEDDGQPTNRCEYSIYVVTNCGIRGTSRENVLIRYSIDPKTVGQFTGLKDKNVVEIYEGDIVVADDDKDYIDCVTFNRCGFRLDPTNDWFWDYIDIDTGGNDKHLRIIGNIHDNPKLLENK